MIMLHIRSITLRLIALTMLDTVQKNIKEKIKNKNLKVKEQYLN